MIITGDMILEQLAAMDADARVLTEADEETRTVQNALRDPKLVPTLRLCELFPARVTIGFGIHIGIRLAQSAALEEMVSK